MLQQSRSRATAVAAMESRPMLPSPSHTGRHKPAGGSTPRMVRGYLIQYGFDGPLQEDFSLIGRHGFVEPSLHDATPDQLPVRGVEHIQRQ